jgi:hypothetical protein
MRKRLREILPDLDLLERVVDDGGFVDPSGRKMTRDQRLEQMRTAAAALDRVLENPRTRNVAKFVVRCPRGHPMGRVYVVKDEVLFVSSIRFGDGTNIAEGVRGAARHPSNTLDHPTARVVEQAVEYVDFVLVLHESVPLRAQCECRYGLISRQWLAAQLGEGKRGATWQGWEWYSELADETP